MKHITLDGKKYRLRRTHGGNSVGLIDFDEHTVGKVMEISDRRRAQEGARALDTQTYSENPWREVEVHRRVNGLIARGARNLVRLDRHLVLDRHIVLLLERFDGDLGAVIDRLDAKALRSVFFRTLFALALLQSKLGFYQGDFGPRNLLYRAQPGPDSHDYTLAGTTYRVPNEGYHVAVADYGNAIIRGFELAPFEREYYPRAIANRTELAEVVDLFAGHLRARDPTGGHTLALNDYVHANFLYRRWGEHLNVDGPATGRLDAAKMLRTLFGDYAV